MVIGHHLSLYVQEMNEDEFSSHVEALATKRLEKPKKMSVKNGKYWSEILSKHLNFDRDTVEVGSPLNLDNSSS